MYSPVVPGTRRKRPAAGLAAHLVEHAENRCAYCTIPIGATVMRKGRSVCLRREWDHFRPHSVIFGNPKGNWQLACHVCNGIKSADRYDTVEDASQVILRARSQRGYESVRDTWARLVAEPYSPWGDPPLFSDPPTESDPQKRAHCDWCGTYIRLDEQGYWRDRHGDTYCIASDFDGHEPAAEVAP